MHSIAFLTSIPVRIRVNLLSLCRILIVTINVLSQVHLIFSSFTVITIALLYGVSPAWFFETFLMEAPTPSIDQSHILRAVMMLYIGLAAFWLFCAFSDKYRDAGVIVVAVFCGGLVSGRILSVLIDGMPSPILILYIFMELGMVPICLWLLKRDKQASAE